MLTVDTREARTNPAAADSLVKLLGEKQVDTNMLLFGDFAALDTPLTMGVEHKTFSDLTGSMSSNRLDRQMAGLIDSYDVPVLLVDSMPAARGGKLSVFRAHSVHLNWVMGMIFGWSLRGIIPMMVRTPTMVGPTVAALYNTVSKAEHRTTYEPTKILDNLTEMTLTERVLLQLPGIGPERAAAMKSYTLEGLNTLNEDGWKYALGPLTGARAFAAWHGK